MVFDPKANLSWIKQAKLVCMEVHKSLAKLFDLPVSRPAFQQSDRDWCCPIVRLGAREGPCFLLIKLPPHLSTLLQDDELAARVDKAFQQFIMKKNGEHDVFFSPRLLTGP